MPTVAALKEIMIVTNIGKMNLISVFQIMAALAIEPCLKVNKELFCLVMYYL
jgi:hypothetical protein